MRIWTLLKKSNGRNDKRIDPKVYWTVLNNFLNNINIPFVPPILISGETISYRYCGENKYFKFLSIKKRQKYLVKNYRPISLLPIFAKVFERLLLNSIFSCFYNNNLFTKFQLDFMPGDSCISQLLSIVHEIQS